MSGRIVFVIGSLDYGGAERHLVQVLPDLAARGWDVSVFTLSWPGEQSSELRNKGITVAAPPRLGPRSRHIVYRGVRVSAAALSYVAYLVRHRPDVVHFFLPQAYLVGGLCALAVGPRCLVMSRRSRNFYQRRYPRLAQIERFLHRRMSAVLGNSRPVVADLLAEGVPVDRLGLIHNGIDLGAFAAPVERGRMRRSLGVAEDELLFIKVANLIPYKGHADLLESLAGAALPVPWRLVCVGRDDGTLPGLQDLASRLGLADKVTWIGPRTDVPALLAAADVGVLASHEEGFSNAVLEYMAAGLPSVVTDVGGNAEAVEDGVTGFVVPLHGGPTLADALARIVDPQLRRRMGLAARSRVAADFSLRACTTAYDALYRSLLAGGGIPAQQRAGCHSAHNSVAGSRQRVG
jgi:glycosyltransferase involved in cell wall biosynthesis